MVIVLRASMMAASHVSRSGVLAVRKAVFILDQHSSRGTRMRVTWRISGPS
jgi:hypothetical protein